MLAPVQAAMGPIGPIRMIVASRMSFLTLVILLDLKHTKDNANIIIFNGLFSFVAFMSDEKFKKIYSTPFFNKSILLFLF